MASATPVEVISLVGILRYFKDYDSLIEKGDIKYANGYVLQVRILEMNIDRGTDDKGGGRRTELT